MFCWSLFVLLYFFLLAIVLSVLLRYTDSDCPFHIFKLFLFPDAGLSTRNHNTGEVILWIPSSLCPKSYYEATNTDKKQPQGSHQVNSQKTRHFDICIYYFTISSKMEFQAITEFTFSISGLPTLGEHLSPIITKVVSSNPDQERCIRYNIIYCDKVRQWLAAGRWISLGTLVSSTNKTDHHDITEILLKVALNTMTLILK